MNQIISCQQLSKDFGSKRALDQASFSIDSGETVALVGPNGAGKTTLFSILCGYLLPSQGKVNIFGHAPGSSALHGRIAALPQDAQLDPRFAVSHQLALFARLQGMGKKAALDEARRVLARVELSEVFNEKPAALSHGMRKRVSIAQTMIGDPQLIMLDEPTAGLDPANARNIRQMVAGLSADTSIIISSHNLSELERLCNKVLLLDQGKLSEQELGSQISCADYLTLLLEPQDGCDPLPVLEQLRGVVEVRSQQKNEYLIRYDGQLVPDMDIQLLQCLASHQWSYRQLLKGRTLEEQLFSTG